MARIILVLLVLLIPATSQTAEPEPWGTYRGNPQRTGNTDNHARAGQARGAVGREVAGPLRRLAGAA